MLSKPREKAPAGAGTPTRAEGKGLATTFPYQDHSTVTREKLLISDMLHEGAENGLTLTELVQLTGEDERSIRRRIQAERKAGKLILADCKNGYFLPTSTLDIQRFIRSMSRRSREIAAISHAAEDALLKMTGQETLRGWQNG